MQQEKRNLYIINMLNFLGENVFFSRFCMAATTFHYESPYKNLLTLPDRIRTWRLTWQMPELSLLADEHAQQETNKYILHKKPRLHNTHRSEK